MAIEVYTADEIAEKLHTTTRTIREHIKRGDLKAVKIGGKYIISEDNLRNFVNGN